MFAKVMFSGALSIQQKLFTALAVILVLMAGMLAAGLTASAIQNDLSNRLINRLVPLRASVRDVKQLIVIADDEGAWYLLATNPAQRARALHIYRGDVAQITASLGVMQRAAQVPEERIALAQARKWWSDYLAGNARAFSLSREGRTAAAHAMYVASAYTPVTRALSLYESVIQTQIDRASKQRADVGLALSIIAGVLSAAALSLAIVAGLRFGGSLRRRLRAVSNALADVVQNDLVQLDADFRSIAAGDLTGPRYVYARKPIETESEDEIGLLAQSYNDLLESLRHMSRRIDHAVTEARQRREAEERLAYLEQYDEATGLPNRHLLQLQLQHAIDAAERPDQSLAVVYFGLAGFKKIEDSFGHAFAQQALGFMARRLRSKLRERDIAARAATDEFIVVLDPVDDREQAAEVARWLTRSLSSPLMIDGKQLLVNVVAGVSVCPYDGDDADELLRNANTAMSYARDTGVSEVVLYAARLRKRSQQRLTLESDLLHALAESQFELHYQPIVNVPERRIDAFEALLRWRHPKLGLLEPDAFIDIAEDTTTIERIGSWVVQAACEQVQKWRSDGYDIGVSVNVSMRQFRGDLVEVVKRALRRTSFPPESLELELTESVLLTDRQRASKALSDLKDLGVRLAIDDFGTGYSSLAYLRTFPLDGLKIDRSFVSDITKRSYDRAIANTIILLGHSLGVRVVAEGVEEAGQAAALHELGCDAMQGYFFGKPAPPDESLALLKTPLAAG